jgi:hypothetical protein
MHFLFPAQTCLGGGSLALAESERLSGAIWNKAPRFHSLSSETGQRLASLRANCQTVVPVCLFDSRSFF